MLDLQHNEKFLKTYQQNLIKMLKSFFEGNIFF